MNIFRGEPTGRADYESQAIAKIAFLTSMFERLVAEAGLRRERIEQMLAELSEERVDVKRLDAAPATVPTQQRRAA